jgi:hypothetical protein
MTKSKPKAPTTISHYKHASILTQQASSSLNERKVSLDTVHAALYDLNQERIKEKDATKPNLIRYIECSMSTGSGLRFIYAYLGIPFLQLQVSISRNPARDAMSLGSPFTLTETDLTLPNQQIESMKQQLESKAIEAVNLLDELDQSNEVPEQLQRIRGQDNFQQRKFLLYCL